MRIPPRSGWLAVALIASTTVPLAGAAPAAVAQARGDSASGLHGALPGPKITGNACASKTGVTVVVDFRNLLNTQGRKMNLIKIGCARQPVGDGFDALLGAGFAVDPAQPFVCTIDDRPVDPQRCPPPDGFWSYSHGVRGKNWQLSGQGAGGWHPAAGSLEGWSWAPYGHTPPWSFPRLSPKDLFPARAERPEHR